MGIDEPLIQVAGVIDQAEADLLLAAGVRWLGFPLRLPVHTEDLSEAEAAAIIRNLPEDAFGVLITYLSAAEAIAEFASELGARAIQLHGEIPTVDVKALRRLLPDAFLIKSLVVGKSTAEHLEMLVETLSPFVDAFITDTHDPVSGADGATGKVHDWQVSRRLVEISPRPVILAGGLNPDNVSGAIATVQPAGVDVHTGVEDSKGRKSEKAVRQFVERARKAFFDDL